jgi:predicted GIY-YIG superfamily endonuclease
MWYVYVLKSKGQDWRYIGSTNDLKRRFGQHNRGEVQSSKAYRPFEMEAYVAVQTEDQARSLEHYFKTGSGKTILKKRILQTIN